MIIAGIDPDLSGGLVMVQFPENKILDIKPMPFIKMEKGRRLDAVAAFSIIDAFSRKGCRTIVCEQALVRPQFGKGGMVMQGGIHTTHQTLGGLRALCEITMERVHMASPSSWKKKMGVTSDKDLTRERAIDLHPEMSKVFSLKKNTGIAEAVLLCHWANEFKMNI